MTTRRELFSLEEVKLVVIDCEFAHPEQVARRLGLEPTHSARVLVGQALAVLGWRKFSRRCWVREKESEKK